jgi:hypothetical protein
MCSFEGSGIAEGETRAGPAEMVSEKLQDNEKRDCTDGACSVEALGETPLRLI